MPVERRRGRLLVGVASGAVAVAATFAANRYVVAPFILFFPAVFVAAWWGDRLGGWVCTAASTLASIVLIGGGPLGWLFVVGVFVPSAILVVLAVSRLHAALRAREMLMSIVSHDLKSPLTAILLQEQVLARLAREQRSLDASVVSAHVARVERQLAQILGLVNNLLDVAQLAARQLRLTREKVHLVELARAVVERFRPLFAEAGYQVTIEDRAAEPVGDWDPGRIEQVVANLLSNAVKFGGGKPIHLCIRDDARSVTLEVRDNGRGFSPERRRHIFDRFERAADTSGPAGHGLGLWIVRTFVEAHGGTVAVDSTPGEGASFTVELPRSVRASS